MHQFDNVLLKYKILKILKNLAHIRTYIRARMRARIIGTHAYKEN